MTVYELKNQGSSSIMIVGIVLSVLITIFLIAFIILGIKKPNINKSLIVIYISGSIITIASIVSSFFIVKDLNDNQQKTKESLSKCETLIVDISNNSKLQEYIEKYRNAEEEFKKLYNQYYSLIKGMTNPETGTEAQLSKLNQILKDFVDNFNKLKITNDNQLEQITKESRNISDSLQSLQNQINSSDKTKEIDGLINSIKKIESDISSNFTELTRQQKILENSISTTQQEIDKYITDNNNEWASLKTSNENRIKNTETKVTEGLKELDSKIINLNLNLKDVELKIQNTKDLLERYKSLENAVKNVVNIIGVS